MKKHPILLGLVVFGVLLGLFLISLYALAYLSDREESLWGGEKIAIIEVQGVILDPQPVVEKLVKLRKNEKVKAIVLRIDSPGGGVGPAQEIFAEVKKARKEKKVLVSMGSVAASGGYYIACGADKILANPGSITGSIGVIVESLNVEELLRKLGLRSMVVKSGKHKDLGSPLRPMTEEERKLLQGVIDSVHEQFIRAVAEGRKLPVEKVRELADGRIFSGEQAQELGLVDELGNLEDTLAMAATLAGIRGEPEIIYPEKKRFSLLDFLLQESVRRIVGSLKESAPPLNFLYFWPQN
ncbi:MAG: multidrug transporter [Deltaproteobacteria bacterium SM23_61]|nr:MAG: multidrug transporter [Deltaproteobacteria bacterium SM23_61]